MDRAIYACDIGSVRAGSFAWVRADPRSTRLVGSACIDSLVESLFQDITSGNRSVALGLEAPLFMPVPDDSQELNSGRDDEGQRSMFAPAGATVTTLGLHEVAWILASLRNRLGRKAEGIHYTLNGRDWRSTGGEQLLLWEAFVSEGAHAGQGEGRPHLRDAATAAAHFRDNEQICLSR